MKFVGVLTSLPHGIGSVLARNAAKIFTVPGEAVISLKFYLAKTY